MDKVLYCHDSLQEQRQHNSHQNNDQTRYHHHSGIGLRKERKGRCGLGQSRRRLLYHPLFTTTDICNLHLRSYSTRRRLILSHTERGRDQERE